jgi:hypothetical protein
MHTGSNHALFLDREWHGKQTSHIPRSDQIKIRSHFEWFAADVLRLREGKQVELIHNGDAIDGDHHHSGDVCTVHVLEQADIHIELMNEFQKRINWQAGDKLYYTTGTRVHTGENEDYIGRELNAEMNGDNHAFEFLELNTNGVLSWFVHHGPKRGGGANEGNIVRNWLKDIYFDALKDERVIPDIVYSGHVHDPTYSSYVYRHRMNFKAIHGIVCPSWQMKTAYAYMRAPVSISKVGGVIHEIKADGTVAIPVFNVMAT